jgi:hypothetical protein
MRSPAYLVAVAFLMAGPALDVFAAREDLPGIGAFASRGAPVDGATPRIAA